MCFAKKAPHRVEFDAKYNEEDGSVNEDENSSSNFPYDIPNDMPEHVDSDNSAEIQEGILGHIYETKDETVTVWMSAETYALDCQEARSLESQID